MLTKLTIKNFKRFKNQTSVDFEPITMLLGSNNSGKSTILQALSIFQYCIEVTRKKKNGEITLENRTIGLEEFGALPVASPTDLWPNGRASGPVCIRAEFDGGASIGFEIKLSYNRFGVAPSLSGDVSRLLDETRIRYVPIHSGLALREEYLLAPARAERLRELQHGSIIRNLLWDLKENDPKRWKLLKEVLERLYPTADIDVIFDKDVDRFISSKYQDQVLERTMDVVVSGTGFQQVLQIFSGVLTQGTTIALMDEPDAHLHARLQIEMTRVFEKLSAEEGVQFVLATHSAHLLAAAPSGSLRAIVDGKAYSLANTPEQVDLLDTLGAFDRMEIVPLLRTKAIVFVENRDDRDYLEMFARKMWGDAKTRRIWEGLSFLFTYQDPISADVKKSARQVKDLLNSNSLGELAGGRQPRFLVIGDRDYRSRNSVDSARRELQKKAKSDEFKLDLRCVVWERNEIENYLLDEKAIERAVVRGLADPDQAPAAKEAVRRAIQEALNASKTEAHTRIAGKLQHEDYTYRGDFAKASRDANSILQEEWGDGCSLSDAKRVLSRIRSQLQAQNIRSRLTEAAIVGSMSRVPAEVEKVLKLIQKHASGSKKPDRKPTT